MSKLNKFEAWAKETYNPKEVPWKRPVLFVLSLAISIACAIAAYTQINSPWTNNGVWLVIGLFGFLAITGLFVSIKCKDFWVALVLGGI
jgi:hypothetical protein